MAILELAEGLPNKGVSRCVTTAFSMSNHGQR
jgi:hypothetical protein